MTSPKQSLSFFNQNRRNASRMRLIDELFDAMDRMAGVQCPPPMTPEEIAEEARKVQRKQFARRNRHVDGG